MEMSWSVVLAIVTVVLLVRWLGWLKGIPIKKTTAGLLALLCFAGGVYFYDWFGIKSALSGAAPAAPTPVTPSGVTFMVLGSESDPNLLYDGLTRTFSVTVKDNSTSKKVIPENVVFTLTVYRTDTVSTGDKPPVVKVDAASVPTFQVVGDVQTYSAIARTTEGQWNIQVTPAGGSTLYQTAYGTVPDGGSKAFTVCVWFDYTGVSKATDGSVHTVQFNAAGVTFTLSIVIGTAVS